MLDTTEKGCDNWPTLIEEGAAELLIIMKSKSQWLKGFLDAEEEVKSGVSRISLEIDHVTFHYPEGG